VVHLNQKLSIIDVIRNGSWFKCWTII